MSSSVLGKRARRTIEEGTFQHRDFPRLFRKCSFSNSFSAEVAVVAPPRKRVTRGTAPQIYEDAPESRPASCRKDCTTRSGVIRSSRKRISTVKKIEDAVLPDAPELSTEVQDENRPPVDVAVSTPSADRFKNVLDTTPITPKHRVRVLGGLLTPRTPRSIDALRTREHNLYAKARQLFTQSAAPARLIGRETERQQLRSFIQDSINTSHGGCTYVSGPPGTGKSALVQEVLDEFENVSEVRISTINCVSLRTSNLVYGKMLEDLAPGSTSTKGSAETQLRRLFTGKSGKMTYVVMLDEVDSLVDVECEILYNIFEWAMHPSTSLTLIGIANALDLTDRFLPRLKVRGLKPQLLPFLPYTAQQISDIISDKLRSLLPKTSTASPDFVPCMQPAAIQLCGKKIASQTGDLRKAFNLVRRAIEQVEKEALARQGQNSPSKQPLGEVTNPSTQVPSSLSSNGKVQLNLSVDTAPRATIAHVAKLASSIFNNGTLSRLGGLNLQQKAVLCSIVSKESRRQARNVFITPTKTANKAPTIGELFVKYTSLCKRDEGILQPLKDTEFRDVVASLETLGLVHESGARGSSFLTPSSSSRGGRNNDDRQIVSAVAEKEMRESLNGPGADLLQRLLDEI